MIFKLLILFVLGVAELWAAAPAGVAMGLPPALTCAVAALGAVCGGVVVILLGERVRRWILGRRREQNVEKKSGLAFRIWQRYGVIGWGLLAPLLVGSPLGAALGLALGAPARRLMAWLAAGSIIWSVVFSLVFHLGWSLLD
jgi:hypothetical protein